VRLLLLLLLAVSLSAEEVEYEGTVEDFTKLMMDVSVEVMVITFEEDWWNRRISAIYTDMKSMTVRELIKRKRVLTIDDVKWFFKKGFFRYEYRPSTI
jgi:hypothetical protein